MTKKEDDLIVRFAPSPTGFLHIGGARTALFNYIYAKQKKGKIILRIEDTDKDRNKEEYTEGILKAVKWLEIDFNETKKQSENFAIHKKYLETLIKEGKAYISKEESGERKEVIRFKNPNKIISFNDLIRGNISINTKDLGDFIIAKSLEEPIFHFSNVVDDIIMGVNCIIRGEEHISNTPRQILIWEAINERVLPKYAHIPLILSKEKEKLSKRKHGKTVSLEYYEEEGYLKEAMINFLVFLGFNPGGEREIYSLDEIINIFDISKIQKGGAVFNIEKLNWFNKEYIKLQKEEDQIYFIKKYLKNTDIFSDEIIKKIRKIIIERITHYGEINDLYNDGELDYYINSPKYENPEKIIWKKSDKNSTISNIKEIKNILSENLNEENLENVWNEINLLAEKLGKGDVLWPLRYILSGKDKSPDPKTLLEIIGIKETINRINNALLVLENL